METLQGDLTLTGGAGHALEGVTAALAPGFSVSPEGQPQTLRRTWLDTFDWRLRRARLTLVETTSSGRQETVLTDDAGAVIATHTGPVSWPRQAAGLPDGALRAALDPAAGIRALLPVARAASTVRRLRVLNAASETAAWITIDELTATPLPSGQLGPGPLAQPPRPDAGRPAGRLVITPLHGRRGDAAEIRRRLLAAPGLAEPAGSALEAALAATGRRALDYTGKLSVDLSGDSPARTAMAALLLQLLDMLEANVAGTVRDLDTEFLHDLRVAVRRSRSALKLGGDVLPPRLVRHYRAEFKWLGDATTPTRDLDVYLLDFTGMAGRLVAAAPEDLEPLHANLRSRRAAQQRQLAVVLRSPRFTSLTSDWRAALTGLRPPAKGPSAASFAAGLVSRAHHTVLAGGRAITANSPHEALHDLRKRCKELRYVLEFFASLHDPAAHRFVVARLKRLQDCLGEFQDRQVQRHELEMCAIDMMSQPQTPARALLAMGDLAAQLAMRQQAARAEFAERFAEFSSRAARDRMRLLTAGART